MRRGKSATNRFAGIEFHKSKGQHILKNPLVVCYCSSRRDGLPPSAAPSNNCLGLVSLVLPLLRCSPSFRRQTSRARILCLKLVQEQV